jgi:aminocyclitol acetyltransferase
VVIEDVPAYAVVAGVPAKVKKYRFSPEEIEVLERVQWWNWDDKTMQANIDCFTDTRLFFTRFR